MKLLIIYCVAACLAGCLTNPPEQDSTGIGHRDPRTGLCHDGTAPPCPPPKD